MKTNHQASRRDYYKQLAVCAVACLLGLGLFTGCEEEAIRSYKAPKSPAYTPPTPMGPVSGAGPMSASGDIAWDLPADWQITADGSSMALATFELKPEAVEGETSAPTRITVTELSGPAGGILDNVNRWRGQVGLGPIEKIEQQPIEPVEIDGQPAGLIDLASPPDVSAAFERILVALLPRTQTNSTWFFKMTGPDADVTKQKPNFVSFVESVRFEGATDE